MAPDVEPPVPPDYAEDVLLAQVLRRSPHLPRIVAEMHKEEQHALLTMVDHPLRPNVPRDRVIAAARGRIAAKLGQNPSVVSIIRYGWLRGYQTPETLSDWRAVLYCRLVADSAPARPSPEMLRWAEAVLDTEEPIAQGPQFNNWTEWLNVVGVERVLRRAAEAMARFADEFERSTARLVLAADSDAADLNENAADEGFERPSPETTEHEQRESADRDPAKRALAAFEGYDSLKQAIDNFQTEMQGYLAGLVIFAEGCGAVVPDALREGASSGEFLRHWPALEHSWNARRKELEKAWSANPAAERARALLGLAEVVSPRLAGHDLEAVQSEAKQLRAALEHPSETVGQVAPILTYVSDLRDGNVRIADGVPPQVEELSLRFYRLLESGAFTASASTPGGPSPAISDDVPPLERPTCADTAEDEPREHPDFQAASQEIGAAPALQAEIPVIADVPPEPTETPQFAPEPPAIVEPAADVAAVQDAPPGPAGPGNVSETATAAASPPSIPIAADLAATTSGSEPRPAGEDPTEVLLGDLLESGRYDEAWLAAYTLREASPVPLPIVEAVQLGMQFSPGSSNSEERLRQVFEEVVARAEPLDRATSVLLAAGAMRPAFLAPHTYPVLALQLAAVDAAWVEHLPDVIAGMADFAARGAGIDLGELKRLRMRAHSAVAKADLDREYTLWTQQAPLRTVKLAAATRIWKDWTRPDGAIRRLVDRAKDGRATVREEIISWRDEHEFTRRLDDAQDKFQRSSASRIRFGAKETLARLTSEALDLAENWLDWHAGQEATDTGATRTIRATLDGIKKPANLALAAIDSLQPSGALERAALACIRRCLRDLTRDLEETLASGRTNPLRSRDELLAYLPEVELEPTCASTPGVVLDAIRRHVRRPLPISEAVHEHLARGRVAIARGMLNGTQNESRAEELLTACNQAADEWARRVKRAQAELLDAIQAAQLEGSLTEEEYSEFQTDYEKRQRSLDEDIDRPDLLVRTVDAQRDRLTRLGVARRDALLHRFEDAMQRATAKRIELAPVIEERVHALLDQRAFIALDDVLARLESGIQSGHVEPDEIIPDSAVPEYHAMFVATTKDLEPIAENAHELKRQIQSGVLRERLGLPALDAEQSSLASGAVQNWIELIQVRPRKLDLPPPLVPNLIPFLRWLGFRIDVSVQPHVIGSQARPFLCTHLRVEAGLDAPIPRFGSAANGRHDIVLIWGTLDADSLASWLLNSGKVGSDRPVTVLCFNRVDTASRRRFVHAMRRRKVGAILVDSSLVAWLCAVPPGQRLAAFLGASLPGVADNPYMPEAAGFVPAEMFFGRDEAVDALWRLDGPCVVYGGRQLGKSALLRHVVRRFHDPKNEQFVLYAGAKYAADLWTVLQESLTAEGLIRIRGAAPPDRVQRAVLEQLSSRRAMRILVLLDECDALLDEDSRRNFEQVSRLRDLMTQSERRFRVVFTGLHNVQRFQRIPNQPLAHFGEPLCVGPLSPQSAKDLVEVPLRSLGYVLDPPDLVHRILALTNNHPSLIQLFCEKLVSSMLDRTESADRTPPFVITEETITRTYFNFDLGQKMRARFDWTLDLDPRYRLLGYTVAYLEHDGSPDTPNSWPAHEIHQWARDFWPDAFGPGRTNEDELGGLLSEMVGLGILVGHPITGFRLRSPNVVRLIGGRDAVTNELDLFRTRQYEPSAELHVIHRAIRTGSSELPASPLTLEQEGRLLARERGTDLVIGSAATGIADVAPALISLLNARFASDDLTGVAALPRDGEPVTFEQIRQTYTAHRQNGRSLHLVVDLSAADPLDGLEVVRATVDWVDQRLSAERHYIKITLIAGPRLGWCLHEQGLMRALTSRPSCRVHCLRRWRETGVRQWYGDVERTPPSAEALRTWIEQSGGWPALLNPHLSRMLENVTGIDEPPVIDLAPLADLLGIPEGSPPTVILQLAADLGGELDLELELIEFAAEHGLAADQVRMAVELLLQMDVLIGTREVVQIEPVYAKGLLGTRSKA